MITQFFKTKPLIDDDIAQWIHDVFQWAMDCFDRQEFFERSILVQPSNEFFPGRVDNPHDLAQNIFEHTLKYAGLNAWPFKLCKPEEFSALPPPSLGIQAGTPVSRNSQCSLPINSEDQKELELSYRPEQTGKPADLSSNFAHLFAQHLVMQSGNMPPGGKELVVPATEVLAIFLGFGVLFANSAYSFRGGCGSCYNAKANRQAALTEDETLYSLALYCHLKGIPKKEATKHLKSHLKSSYSRAIAQIKGRASTNP